MGAFKVYYSLDNVKVTKKADKAQYLLDSQIMADMLPYMPMNESNFIHETEIASKPLAGTGWVVAAAKPFGRFLYEGKVMVSSITGSPWARRGVKKVLTSQFSGHTNAKENIEYGKAYHPNVTDHWFEKAKTEHLKEWEQLVKKAFK